MDNSPVHVWWPLRVAGRQGRSTRHEGVRQPLHEGAHSLICMKSDPMET